ncbi:MAG: carboxypeptidase regulatory-like domain-containing protein [Bradymonadaceae bacterium]|nr:carboxypeptidase regulatory-like domain-containing protein [Lujinxingiaceae bacterium]
MKNDCLRIFLLFVVMAFVSACGGCGAGEAGSECHPDDRDSCNDGLVCAAHASGDNLCQIPVGGACDLDDDPSYCQTGSACFKQRDESACLTTRGNTCSAEEAHCAPDLVCAEREGGTFACYSPVVVTGLVFDSEDRDAIEGAHVIALNEEATAVTDVAISGVDGSYALSLPVKRDANGKPLRQFFTLRASAQDYQTFPSGIRTALPIDASVGTDKDGKWRISTALTEIAMIALPESEQGRAAISGRVLASTRSDGVLVVAERDNKGISGVSDRRGHYTIFNVPPGGYAVRGYAAGVQLEPVSATMQDADLTGVDLQESDKGVASVSGTIQIVAAGGGLTTSVVFVVASTFNELAIRGEVPSGLRAPRTGTPNISGSWTIEGVPAGDYVILAGFENDFLVRDPDPGIAGTEIVRITIPASSAPVTIGQSFKVTAALATVSPGATEAELVTQKPMLVWGPLSNADAYSVVVFNAHGNLVWSDDDVAKPSGSTNVSVQYAGPLDDGMYYQFRATAHRRGSPNSTTENLLGVFYTE